MILERLAQISKPLLFFSPIRRMRRNHALEHATITLLSRRVGRLKVAGYSTSEGFFLIGNPSTAQIDAAARDALTRMKKGEHQLALHPNCGTNLVTTAALVTAVAGAGLRTRKPITSDRLSLTFSGIVLALIVAQPLGMALQRHFTTEGDPGDLEIGSIRKVDVTLPIAGPVSVHMISTRKG